MHTHTKMNCIKYSRTISQTRAMIVCVIPGQFTSAGVKASPLVTNAVQYVPVDFAREPQEPNKLTSFYVDSP